MTAMQGALSAAERSMRSVFVGNIPYEATEEQLKDIFAEVGPVVSFRLVYDRETGKPKGYGFCEYKDQEMALSAMRNLNGYELNGRALRVDNAASEKSKEELKNLQASLGGPPVESPYGPEVSPEKAPDIIAKVMASLPPEQLYELMKQMKMSLENNPNETRNLLVQNPQLTYAMLQAQVIMRIVTPEAAVAMLHSPNGPDPNQPPVQPGLLPTPDAKNVPTPTPQVPPVVNDVQATFPSVATGVPSGPMNTVPAMAGGRVAPVPQAMSQTRPSLLGDRPVMPGPPKQMMPNQYNNPERMDSRAMGDHDLRVPPMIDRDMRQPPVMADKDMRQSLGDQDLRTMNMPAGAMPENRQFDPRYRGMPVADRGPTGPSYDRPRVAPNMDHRPGPNMDHRPGPNMDHRPGLNMDHRSGPNMDHRPGPNMDHRPGPNMDHRSGPNIDPRAGPIIDPRAGPTIDPRAGPNVDQRIPPSMNQRHPSYDARQMGVSRMEDPRNSVAPPNPNSRMMPQNPRVAAVSSGSPHIGSSSPNISSPRPAPSGIAAAAASIAPHDQEKANLIMQVLQLTDEQIALLPPEQRQSIMILKEQIARSQNA
ncbi:cleavage stimulation factor subunit 2-like [Uloborus diversus]|uniref:cleavage stimulation factor subunit 2-like n=1 Tax=Uloborus diversus TaxID=327109 RepID=UPI00240A6FCA|nr:cleavage stimulation factor subunit 2-like [Uloborus diversus]